MIKNYNNGFLFSLDKPSELFHLLRMLYQNNYLKNEIKLNAKKYALKHYDKKLIAINTIDFYKKVKNNEFAKSDTDYISFLKKFYFFKLHENLFFIKKNFRSLFTLKTYRYLDKEYYFFSSLCIKYKTQTIQIDLNNKLDYIYKYFTSSVRNEINKSKKISFQILYNNDLSNFYPFYFQFVSKKKIYILKKSFLEKISNHLFFSYLYLDKKLLVSHCYILDNKNALARLFLSVSTRLNEGDDKYIVGLSNKRLTYEDIQYFKSLNYKILDMGGIDTFSKDSQIIGINRFMYIF
jgi:hypothetical protein